MCTMYVHTRSSSGVLRRASVRVIPDTQPNAARHLTVGRTAPSTQQCPPTTQAAPQRPGKPAGLPSLGQLKARAQRKRAQEASRAEADVDAAGPSVTGTSNGVSNGAPDSHAPMPTRFARAPDMGRVSGAQTPFATGLVVPRAADKDPVLR